tara:strand:- start:11826 stop:12437 length:612 start_codon:yes stop_codon:yes gene_type:complete
MKHRILLYAFGLTIFISKANAQGLSDWQFGISTIKESFFYPSKHNFIGPYHPGFSLIAEKQIKELKKSNKILSLETGFYHHKYFQNGVFLLSGLNYEFRLKGRLKLRWGPRLGYLHAFSPTGRYKLKDGEFKQIKDWGRPTALAGLAIGASYPILNKDEPDKAVDLFFNYQVLVEGPFAPGAGVPVVPHTFLALGIKTKLFSK